MRQGNIAEGKAVPGGAPGKTDAFLFSRVQEEMDLLSREGRAAFAIDNTARIVSWNRECERLLGYPANQVLGRHCFEVTGGRDVNCNVYCHSSCPVAHQARSEGTEDDPVRPYVLFVKGVDGNTKRIVVSLYAIPGVRNELSIVIHILRGDEDRLPSRIGHHGNEISAESSEPHRPALPDADGTETDLTLREKQILGCLAEGLPTPVIAQKLFIAPVTVRNHTQTILQKLGVHTKLAAVVFAFRHELIERSAPPAANRLPAGQWSFGGEQPPTLGRQHES